MARHTAGDILICRRVFEWIAVMRLISGETFRGGRYEKEQKRSDNQKFWICVRGDPYGDPEGAEYEDSLSGGDTGHCGRHFPGTECSEWCICLLLFALVISLELVNTAVEAVVDLVTEERKPLAKIAKDTAAGAVLFASLAAVIIGCIIFIPYLADLFL